MTELSLTLEQCEAGIESAMQAASEHFEVIGRHLTAIRDGKLWNNQYESFDGYCLLKWGFGKTYASRLIASVKVLENLLPMGNKPVSERQTRAIAASSNDPSVRQEVWDKAQEIGQTEQPTAIVIHKAAEIVTTGSPANHESIEVDQAVKKFAKLVEKLIETGKEIQTAVLRKCAVSRAMQQRQATFEKRIINLAAQTEILKEHSNSLSENWSKTRKQVDE